MVPDTQIQVGSTPCALARLEALALSPQCGAQLRQRWGAFSCGCKSKTEEQRAAARSVNEEPLNPPLQWLYGAPSSAGVNCYLLS